MKKILFILFIILLSGFVSAGEINNAVSSFLLDENYTDNANSNDGTNTGTTLESGFINNAAEFDATSDKILLANEGNFDFERTDNFSISFWAKKNAFATSFYICKQVASGNFEGWCIWQSGNDLIITLESTTTNKIVEAYDISSHGTNWFHVTVTYSGCSDSSCLDLYINNSNKTTTVTTNALSTSILNNVQVEIGNRNGAFNYNGLIDELIIYNFSLSSSNITDIYNNYVVFSLQYPFVELENLSINQSTYNMTSDGGCTSWRTNTSTNCNTTDGTPTFVFDTNRPANCSVRATQSDSDSFPSYNSSFECSTTGGSSHICTVYNIDKLLFEFNYLYASCTDGGNATSGALAINMTAGSGDGLIDCISVVGTGCAAVISDSCAAIIK